ncbi:unnamed protein product, partial [Meganyctiphanes norvegica]
NDRLQLTCRDFQLENSRDCSGDYLAVDTSSGYIQRFCGYYGPSNFESSGRIRIMFTSNWNYAFRGFSCSLTVSSSGTIATSGTIPTPEVTPSTGTLPQCKCGQQQDKRKKRSSNLPKWLQTNKGEGIQQETSGNKTHKGRLFHPLRNRYTIRVIGGSDAKLHEFPWVVLITYEKRIDSRCGGAIINSKYIITAAHCLLKSGPPFSPLDP